MSGKESIAPKEWMTAAEIARLKLTATPHTERGINLIASSEDWRESTLARRRSGRGGGWEYHFNLLPEAAINEVVRRFQDLGRDAKGRELAKAAGTELVRAQPEAAKLNGRQRGIMEARAAVLTEVDRRVLCGAGSQSKAINQLILDLNAIADRGEHDHLLDAARAASKQKSVPSRAEIYRWLKARHEMGLVGLAPRPENVKKPLPDWFEGWLKHYARPAKPCITDALDEYRRTLPDKSQAPTYDQVRRALGKLGPLERVSGREGKLAMRKRLAYVSRDTTELLPTTVYVADGKMYDAEIAHPIHGHAFRPELSSIIDAATRVCVGWSADLSEKAFAVAEALRHSCEDFGIPALFYTDRGPGYISNTMSDPVIGFLSRAGITGMKALPYNAQAKGIVERLNQIYTRSAKRFVTYIGADMDREARHLAYKATRGELKEFGTSKTLPSWQAFLDEIAETIATYNNTPHSALPTIREGGRKRHMTPMEMWDAKCADGFAPILPDELEVQEMFRPYEIRKTRRGLIEFNTNSYFLHDLENIDGEEVVVGYDTLDARQVWVRKLDKTPEGKRPGAFLGVAVFEGNKTRYVPLSVDQAAQENRTKGRIRRLDDKRDRAELELKPWLQLELAANQPLSVGDLTSPSGKPVQVGPANPSATAKPMAANDHVVAPKERLGPDGRPLFGDDVAYAAWIVAHPDQSGPDDVEIITGILSSANTRDILRAKGIDLEALKSLRRSIA